MPDPASHPPTLDYNTPQPSNSFPPLDQESFADFNKPKPRVAIWLFSSFLISLFTYGIATWLELDRYPNPKNAYVRWSERFLDGLFCVMLLSQFMAFYKSAISRRNFALSVLTIILLPIYCFPWLLVGENPRAKEGRINLASVHIKSIEDALEALNVDSGQYPTSAQGLRILISNPDNNPNWHGPYLKIIPLDPWNSPYRYTIPGVHSPASFDLASAGPDGVLNTVDDLTNW